MSAETTATTVAGIVNTSLVLEVGDYPMDSVVLAPRLEWAPVGGAGSNTAKFSVATKSTAVTAPGDGTALSNAALAFTGATVAASEFGIKRVVTKGADRFSIFGEGGVTEFAKGDGVRLCWEYAETLALAILTSASTSVGTTGAALTLGNLSLAKSKASINNAKGQGFYVLTKFQARDMREAATSSGASLLPFIGGVEILQGPNSEGFTGNFMGSPMYESGLCPTASADQVGAYLMDGSAKMAPIGAALGWAPEVVEQVDASYPAQVVTVTMSAGFIEKQDKGYVKIVTIGS